MNMKQALCVLFALVLMIGAVGCGRNNDNDSSIPQGSDEVSLGGAEAGNSQDDNDRDEIVTPGPGEEFGDENVTIDLQLTKEGYTLNESVELAVTVTNIADRPIVYVHGSGSNIVPDALELGLSELSAMFHPFQMTMDYGVHSLQPGESKTFEVAYAPYRALSEDTVIGLDRDIDFFQTEEFEPVEHGTHEGHFKFTYYLSDEEDDEDMLLDLPDRGEAITIEGTFRTDIIEGDAMNDGDLGTEFADDTGDVNENEQG